MSAYTPPSIAKIESALAAISPDCDYETWLKVATALKTELGDGGRDLFTQWSSASGTEREAAQKWKGARAGAVSIGWLFNTAKANGWSWQGGESLSDTELARRLEAQAAAQAKAEREAEQLEARHKQAAIEAARIYETAQPVESHPYLERKGVAAADGLRVAADGRLIVPVYSPTGAIQSLQYIAADGVKKFLKDAAAAGGWFAVGDLGDSPIVWIAEGFATAATLHAATGQPVVVAFSAGNLSAVVGMLRQHSKAELRAMVDNDRSGAGIKAALSAGADGFWLPAEVGTDFNDWRDRLPKDWLTGWRYTNISVGISILPPETVITLTNGTAFTLSTLRGRKLNGAMVTLANGTTGKLNMGNKSDKSRWHIVTTEGVKWLLDTTPQAYKGAAVAPKMTIGREDVGKAIARLARETVQRGGATVLSADGGAGKSRGVTRIDEALKLLVALPTIELAEQHAASLKRLNDVVVIYRGRGQVADGVAMCQRWEEWRALPIPEWKKSAALCQKIRPETGEADLCPNHSSCPYIQQRARLAEATMVLAAHNYLTIGLESYRPDLVIADESIVGLLSGGHDSVTLEEFSGDMLALVARVKGELQQGRRAILTTEERLRAGEWLGEQTSAKPLLPIYPSMTAHALKQAIEHIKSQMTTATNYEAAGLIRALLRDERNGVWLGVDGALFYLNEKPKYAIKALDTGAAEKRAAEWQVVLNTAPAKLAAVDAAIAAGGGDVEKLYRRRARLVQALERAEYPSKRESLKPAPLLVLDGTAREPLYRALLGESMRFESWRVRDAEKVRVIRYAGNAWNASSWQEQNSEGKPNGVVKAGAGGWVAAVQKLTGLGVIANKKLTEAAVKAGAPAEALGHFGKVRGLNRFESLAGVVMVGRDEPNCLAVESQARAIWRDAELNLSGEYQRQLTSYGSEINGHSDERVAQVLASLRDDELTQTAWRTRHVWQAGKTVVIVGTTPCPRFDALAELRDNAELPPEILGKLVEAVGAEVVPVGKAFIEQVIADDDSKNGESKESTAKRKSRELKAWGEVNQGGHLLNIGINKWMTPLFSYRVQGESGSPREALALSDVTHAQAKAALAKIHGKVVNLVGETVVKTAPSASTTERRATHDWYGLAALATARRLLEYEEPLLKRRGELIRVGLEKAAELDMEFHGLLVVEAIEYHPVMVG